MNDARQGPTTPSPRNAPPMTDRERIAGEVLDVFDQYGEVPDITITPKPGAGGANG